MRSGFVDFTVHSSQKQESVLSRTLTTICAVQRIRFDREANSEKACDKMGTRMHHQLRADTDDTQRKWPVTMSLTTTAWLLARNRGGTRCVSEMWTASWETDSETIPAPQPSADRLYCEFPTLCEPDAPVSVEKPPRLPILSLYRRLWEFLAFDARSCVGCLK